MLQTISFVKIINSNVWFVFAGQQIPEQEQNLFNTAKDTVLSLMKTVFNTQEATEEGMAHSDLPTFPFFAIFLFLTSYFVILFWKYFVSWLIMQPYYWVHCPFATLNAVFVLFCLSRMRNTAYAEINLYANGWFTKSI